MKGAVHLEVLEKAGVWSYTKWKKDREHRNGIFPLGGGTCLFGIRKGRTARRVRRCLRREQQRVDASLRAQGLPAGDLMAVWR